MFMEQFGYFLSEAPVLILMIWFAVRYVQVRRYRENRPAFTEDDRFILFHADPAISPPWRLYSRLTLAILAFAVIGYVEIVVLAPFGAAIVGGTLLLTAAHIVRRTLLLGD